MAKSKRTKSKSSYDSDDATTMGICGVPATADRALPSDIDPFRASLIRHNEKKWVNGTVIHYYFFQSPVRWRGAPRQQDAVRQAFKDWKDLGIGLEFKEVSDPSEAEVRIGFDYSDGSWSYIGRDAIDYASDPKKRTMNFGWDLTTSYGRDTALHEIGHALGFPHEHQNPFAGIVWDEDRVNAYFSGPPNNWDERKIHWNILRKIDQSEVDGSAWDPDSIMHYGFNRGLIIQPERYQTESLSPKPGFSRTDIKRVRKFYPPLRKRPPELKPFRSLIGKLEPGEQIDYEIRPDATRKYVIQTFGESDTVMVLFEKLDNGGRYISGDDDGGQDRNARIEARMRQGATYTLRVRLYYAYREGDFAVMAY